MMTRPANPEEREALQPTRSVAAAVGLMVGLVFLPVVAGNFVNWDDDLYVSRVPFGQALASGLTRIHASGNWHPLTTLSHAIDHALWGMWPAGHHLTSLVLHGINASLVVMLAAALFRARVRDPHVRQSGLLLAVMTGLLWGLHPLRVESAAWISERKDLLCALFYVLGLLAHLRYARTAERRWYAGALACCGLALLSKPMAVSFPFLLVVLDAYPLERLRRAGVGRVLAEKVPFVLLAALIGGLTLHGQRLGGAMRALHDVPFTTRTLVAAQSLVGYVGKTLMPAELHALYLYPRNVTITDWRFALPVLLIVVVVTTVVHGFRHHKALAAALAAYFLLLVPVLGIVQVGPQASADRYTYLPGIALALLFGATVDDLWHRTVPTARLWLTLSALAMILGLSWLSSRQIAVWRNSETLWSRSLAFEPGSIEAHNSRADYYYGQHRFQEALFDYTAALAGVPATSPAHAIKRRAAILNDRAVTFVQLHMLERAIADETEAIRLQEGRMDYYLNRARMLRLAGRIEDAATDERRARRMADAALGAPK